MFCDEAGNVFAGGTSKASFLVFFGSGMVVIVWMLPSLSRPVIQPTSCSPLRISMGVSLRPAAMFHSVVYRIW